MSDIPSNFDTFYNPITELISEYAAEIQLADELATHYVGDDDLLPSHLLHILAQTDVNEIRNNGARIHHRAQEVYETLLNSKLSDLLTNSWSGDDAAAFEDYIAGGGGHRGLNRYLDEVKERTETHAWALINLGEDLREGIIEVQSEATAALIKVREGQYEAEAAAPGFSFKDVLMWVAGAAVAVGGALFFVPGVNILVAIAVFLVGVIIGVIVLLIDKAISEANKMENAARTMMTDFTTSVESGGRPGLPSEQVDDLGPTEW